jgi:hypothetical protein
MRAKRNYFIGALILLTVGSVTAQTKPMAWDRWQFLIGKWRAVGRGAPGEGKGGFSFTFDLQNKIITRKSHTDYPAAAGRPAFAHDDLMVIYADDAAQKCRADYYDNEGHVIRYTAEFSTDGKAVVFISDPVPSQPRFRLTYMESADASLTIKFEIAAPTDPEVFRMYVEGTAQRVALTKAG